MISCYATFNVTRESATALAKLLSRDRRALGTCHRARASLPAQRRPGCAPSSVDSLTCPTLDGLSRLR